MCIKGPDASIKEPIYSVALNSRVNIQPSKNPSSLKLEVLKGELIEHIGDLLEFIPEIIFEAVCTLGLTTGRYIRWFKRQTRLFKFMDSQLPSPSIL